jgi:hypothetical protein
MATFFEIVCQMLDRASHRYDGYERGKPVAMFARQLWIEKLNGQPVCWSREFGLSKLVVK